MAFKTRRQQRYVRLRESGILPFEAKELSKTTIESIPYLKQIVKDRKQLLKQARKEKLTTEQFEAKIKKTYRDNGWTRREVDWMQFYDPWAMFRQYEDAYRAKNKEYNSPWRKRRQAWKDFVSKYEKTVARQTV